VVEHQRLQLARHGDLSASGSQCATFHQVGQGGVGGLARQTQQRDLSGVLDLAQRLNRTGGTHQLGAPVRRQLTGQGVEAVDGHDVALEPDSARAPGQRVVHQVASAGPFDGHVEVGCLPRGLGPVPGVGGQHGGRISGEHQ